MRNVRLSKRKPRRSHSSSSRSSSRGSFESGELSFQDSGSQSAASDFSSSEDERKSRREKKLKRHQKQKKHRSFEETFDKMQRIISKKGYVDAHALKKLAKKIDFNRVEEDTLVKAKAKVGSGDHKQRSSSKSNAKHRLNKKGKVKFAEVDKQHNSPSDITIYQLAVKLKFNLKRQSTSSEDEADMDVDCFDSSNEMYFLDHNSHQMITDNFIADMKRHYDEQNKRQDDHTHQEQVKESGSSGNIL